MKKYILGLFIISLSFSTYAFNGVPFRHGQITSSNCVNANNLLQDGGGQKQVSISTGGGAYRLTPIFQNQEKCELFLTELAAKLKEPDSAVLITENGIIQAKAIARNNGKDHVKDQVKIVPLIANCSQVALSLAQRFIHGFDLSKYPKDDAGNPMIDFRKSESSSNIEMKSSIDNGRWNLTVETVTEDGDLSGTKRTGQFFRSFKFKAGAEFCEFEALEVSENPGQRTKTFNVDGCKDLLLQSEQSINKTPSLRTSLGSHYVGGSDADFYARDCRLVKLQFSSK